MFAASLFLMRKIRKRPHRWLLMPHDVDSNQEFLPSSAIVLRPSLSSPVQHASPSPVVQWAVREWGGKYEDRYLGENIFVFASLALFGVRCGLSQKNWMVVGLWSHR